MKVAVYNRYWHTGGGGEKVAGVIAETLAADADVTLLGHTDIDVDWLGERLGLDLANTRVELLDDTTGALGEAAAGRDLLVNASFMSHEPCTAERGLYYVHFPSPLIRRLGPVSRRAVDAFGMLVRDRPKGFRWGEGFHAREPGRRSPFWTSGSASLDVIADEGRRVPVEIVLGFHRPAEAGDAEVRILVDDEAVVTETLGRYRSTAERLRGRVLSFEIEGRGDDPVVIRIESDTFVPADLVGGTDTRRLGVPLLAVQFGSGVGNALGRVFPVLWTPPGDASWLEGYGSVLSNSAFTRRWVERYWGIDTGILHPPVTMHEPAPKEPVILGVGRFFAADQGHSKKQLEMVRAFRQLVDGGLDGWSLHLVGGCDEREEDYLRTVQHLAEGYPVEFHVNASGAELRGLYGKATLYWHAAGYGEDPERHPDRFEHFGITTVEAMSAGAVPVVINRAGQAETVRHGVDGYRFETLTDLVELTARLVANPDELARFAASAPRRAEAFSIDTFRDQLRSEVADLFTRRDASS